MLTQPPTPIGFANAAVELQHAGAEAGALYYCRLCPYKYAVNETVVHHVQLKKKQTELVLSNDGESELGDRVEATCPKCGHDQAFFTQMQTRSADEASTIIYKCCKCMHKWRED